MSDRAGGQKIGGTVGGIGGAAVGTYFGGPVGGMIGGTIGGYGGKLLGGAIGGLFGGDDGPSPQQIYNDQLKAREQAAYDQQSALAETLTKASNGQGPSVAGIQLGQGLDQINRNALTAAAGAGGNNGVLARYGAMQAAAQAGAQANQSAALARAQEIAQARALLGTTLGNQVNESSNMYGTVNGAANGARANDIAAEKNSNDFTSNLLGSGLQAYSSYKALGSSGAPA